MTKTIGHDKPDGGPLGALRLRLRIPTFTAASVGLGVLAHIIAGGSLPGAGMMLLIVAAVALTSASLTRRERSLPSIMLAVTAVQVGMHVALLARHDHLTTAAVDTGPVRLLAHLGAVVALAWWLRRGETAAWQAAVEVWRRHVQLPFVPDSSCASVRDLPTPPDTADFTRALALVIPVRGPPRPA